jgi:hypothetical protein
VLINCGGEQTEFKYDHYFSDSVATVKSKIKRWKGYALYSKPGKDQWEVIFLQQY